MVGRKNMAHVRQTGSASGPGFQVKQLETFELDSGRCFVLGYLAHQKAPAPSTLQ